MAELSFLDTGLLVDFGKSAGEYGGYDPGIFRVTDTSQSFTVGVIYFYFSGPGLFFKSTRKKHAILRAIASVIIPARIEELIDDLDDMGSINDLLNSFDIPRLKRRINRALAKGLITQAERDVIFGVVNA